MTTTKLSVGLPIGLEQTLSPIPILIKVSIDSEIQKKGSLPIYGMYKKID